ncbi:PREDICTED: uncharacterized protein LOC106751668 [Dinoponera quadriceps]|uniref:Uncharacterized protein LOC106751668 n=1 Tax=Dinoponera quadriceps TaxID=609295 RepID=A0A6P3YE25_DINQU|nr:PREDICTED: uncharacterized protein LOC106751668 [Dinoponera quadriceps]
MDIKDYDSKLQAHLAKDIFEKLRKNLTSALKKQTTKLIKNSKLSDLIKNQPSNLVYPRLYGLPKIHKIGISLRPIVNARNSPIYKLVHYLVKRLEPLTGKPDPKSRILHTSYKKFKTTDCGLMTY